MTINSLHSDIRKDVELLKKYYHGASIDPSDKPDVERLCLIGMTNKGIFLKHRMVSVKTAGVGLKLLKEIDEVPE